MVRKNMNMNWTPHPCTLVSMCMCLLPRINTCWLQLDGIIRTFDNWGGVIRFPLIIFNSNSNSFSVPKYATLSEFITEHDSMTININQYILASKIWLLFESEAKLACLFIWEGTICQLVWIIDLNNYHFHCCDRQSHFSSLMGRQYLISMASSEQEEHVKLV